MGRYSVGQRVRDPDGDLCEIIGKPCRGSREVRLIGGKNDGLTLVYFKSSLTPANDNISVETSENAYSGGVPAWISGQFVNTTDGETAVVESDVDDVDHVWVRHASGQRTRLPSSWLTAWVPKVGDRVVVVNSDYGSSKLGVGKTGEVTAIYRDGDAIGVVMDGQGDDYDWAFTPDQLELAPTLPIHSTVTFTATGRLSAINDNGHMQVTFPGLPAGRNSFALPAEYVALAN